MTRYAWCAGLFAAVAGLAITAAGCGRMGQVAQGRAVGYDAAKGLVTVALEPGPGRAAPLLDMPPAIVRVPPDPNEMGPAPAPGGLVRIDRANRRLIVFDPPSGLLRQLSYTPVDEHANVSAADARVAGKSFPVIDRAARTITIYDPADGTLLTFAASDDQLSLAEETWRAGDEVRYYFKRPGQALRMMNVTRTDIRKSSH